VRRPVWLRANAVIGITLVGFFVAAALIGTVWTPHDPLKLNILQRMKPPGAGFLLGTDEFGRDVLSRLIAGARNSLLIAVLTVAGAVGFGALLGLISGYARGAVDRVLMMVNDALLAFPGILLALGLLAVIGPNKWGIILALALAYMPVVVRVVRGSVLSVRAREFVEASRILGNSEAFTAWRHVMPNCTAPLTVLATSMLGWVLLAEGSLSFLGLGVPPPEATWGNMLSAARPYIGQASWLAIYPGLCISLALLGVNLLGDALRDHLDPQMRL
jgi:peptide/nickel transport system permease protein